jgi:hypothetical protein
MAAPGLGDAVGNGVREPDRAVRRGEADDRARPARANQVAAQLLAHEEGPGEIDGERRLPLRVSDVDRRPGHRDAGVVDKHVEPAERLDRVGKAGLDAILVAVRPQPASMAAAVAARSAGRKSVIATSQPCFARAIAIAAPMP